MQPGDDEVRANSLSAHAAEVANALKSKDSPGPALSTRGDLPPTITVALIEAAPKVAGVLAILIFILVFQSEIRQALTRIGGVEVFGVKLTLSQIESWVKEKPDLGVSASVIDSALRRANRVQGAYRSIRILWVDDNPENNFWERRALESVGATIDVALGNSEASDLIRRKEYNILISDLTRDNGEDSRDLGRRFENYWYKPKVIYYTLKSPKLNLEEAFGVTTHPNELIDLVTDAVERIRR